MNEFKEAWNRIKEYCAFVRSTPKSERTELHKDILSAYEQVLLSWALEKTCPIRAIVKIGCQIVRILVRCNLL